MPYLVLVRHGQSEWNALGKWTGWTDVNLTEQGKAEARKAGEALEGLTFQAAHTSDQKRAHQTFTEALKALNHVELEARQTAALRERDYGELTGKNKWEVREQYGEEQFLKWRRGWNEPIPGGETLKDVHARVVPYYEEHILADLKAGKNVIVAASGNSLRALVKHLEEIAEADIAGLEIGTGEVYLYEIDEHTGQILAKDIKIAGGKA